MSNSLLTIDMITNKSLQILENSLVVTRNVNRQYDDSFAKSGAKIGTTLRIRLPDRALVTDGAALNVQDDNEQYTTLTVDSQKHIGINFTTAELTMQLDDFADRVLKPRISQLAATVDKAVVTNVYKSFYQYVGTPGSTPSTSLVLLQGMARLQEMAVPDGSIYATVNPNANALLVEGMKGFFNPTGTIARQFKSGMMGEGVLGYDEINMSQSIGSHTNGNWGTTITSSGTISTQGSTSLPIAFTGSSSTWNVGDQFAVDAVYSVNPQTRESTGNLQVFTVTAALTATTTGTLTVSPAMYTSGNALATINAFPQASAAVTMIGTAAQSFTQNLIYHKNAITFATADLVMPEGVDMASRKNHNGISMRIVRQYDINNDRLPTRLDVLFGSSAIRPEIGLWMWGERTA